MIEHYRAARDENVGEEKERRAKSDAPQYIFLPNELVNHPPIRHRGENVEVGLSVYEFALAAACVFLARQNIASARHAHSWRKGRGTIRRQRRNMANWHHLSSSPTDFIKESASYAYSDAKLAFDSAPNEKALTIEVSKTKLLRTANISRKGDNWARLEEALQRLTEPAGSFAPALRSWERLPTGKLRLNVDPKWVPQQEGYFTRVLWPLPTGGATILALYLFLSFLSAFKRERWTNISTEALHRRLGIPLSGSVHAERSLDRALAGVNAHYRRYRAAATELEMPIHWRIAPVEDGTRLQFIPYLPPDEAMDDDTFDGLRDAG
jgi:hypothetical protein